MRYFDVNAMIGPYFAPREGHFPTAQECLAEMDFYGIDAALVYHACACEYDNRYGNEQLLERLQGQERLYPAWVLSMPQFGAATFKQDLEEAVSRGVRLVRFFWGGLFSGLSALDIDTLGGLFAELQSRRMPILLANDGAATITGAQLLQVKTVCQSFPELPVILTTPKLGQDYAVLFTMLEKCPNFHLETSSIHMNRMLEEVAGRCGPQHLIFGTNFPWFGGGQAKIALAYANLPEQDKQAIAAGNLQRLTEAVQ